MIGYYMIMNAKKFLDEFLKKIKKKSVYEGRKLFDIYKSDSAYTPVITNIINEIIKEADYTPQNEYFRIDVVGWTSHYADMKKDADEEGIDIKPHLWDLKIAVEHENDKSDWSDEVS